MESMDIAYNYTFKLHVYLSQQLPPLPAIISLCVYLYPIHMQRLLLWKLENVIYSNIHRCILTSTYIRGAWFCLGARRWFNANKADNETTNSYPMPISLTKLSFLLTKCISTIHRNFLKRRVCIVLVTALSKRHLWLSLRLKSLLPR